MKRLCAILLAVLVLSGCVCACAEGVVLKTVSTFAGTDVASETYLELLKNWQEQTGNTVNDLSSASDEAWKTGVLKDFAAGNEADVLFFFACTGDSETILRRVVPIAEINATYPDINLPVDERVTEADGQVYAIPVRPFWEGLFCNADLFERYGLELPTTWEKLETAITTFRNAGIVPIAASLSDVPHYLAEFTILSAGGADALAMRPASGESVPESWVEGMKLLRHLYELGAFADNVNATTEAAASQMFRDKKAAMQVDGSWFANSISPENQQTTVVLPFPSYTGGEGSYIYGVSMGFYLTRSAWEDDVRRDAAVDLLRYLTTGEGAEALGSYFLSGALLQSYEAMELVSAGRSEHPIQDDMQPEARGKWFSSIPGIADGTVDPARMWALVMTMNPFGS